MPASTSPSSGAPTFHKRLGRALSCRRPEKLSSPWAVPSTLRPVRYRVTTGWIRLTPDQLDVMPTTMHLSLEESADLTAGDGIRSICGLSCAVVDQRTNELGYTCPTCRLAQRLI